ncbi:hypothetical protein EYF80_011177 [Liparis tanakae]|uniref:Uncharacterized protein n=1 Tax=Liparis tanakae TaxID=230148 RepID=A0A4Z2IMY4_9TELE|nr:hypothetical protein EYF80_011177 [Liparis tanakae]
MGKKKQVSQPKLRVPASDAESRIPGRGLDSNPVTNSTNSLIKTGEQTSRKELESIGPRRKHA